MELRHLRYFVTTAETGTASAAAARLHVTQPALSRQVRALEAELGVALFDRVGGRLVLSDVGRSMLPLARGLLEQATALQRAAAFYAEGRLDRFTVGAPTVTLTDVVAPFVATLAADDPVADVLDADGLDPDEALRAGADLAIGTARPGPPYRSRPLAVLPVWAYVPAAHAWAARASVTLAEVAAETVISLPAAFTARQAFDAALAEARLGAHASLEAANGTVAQALAAGGRGVAVVSDDPRYDLVALPIETADGATLSIRLVSLWDARHAAADTLDALAQRLSEFTCERYGVRAR